MKYLLTICILWVAGLAVAQEIPVDEKTGKAYYEGVNQVPGRSAAELYNKAMDWIDEQYVNPAGVVQSKDIDEGVIKGRARFRIKKKDDKGNEAIAGFVGYDFTLTFKDGRYKYEIHSIRWEKASYFDVSEWTNTEDNHYDPVNYPYFIEQTTEYFDGLIDSMKVKIEEKDDPPAEDW